MEEFIEKIGKYEIYQDGDGNKARWKLKLEGNERFNRITYLSLSSARKAAKGLQRLRIDEDQE